MKTFGSKSWYVVWKVSDRKEKGVIVISLIAHFKNQEQKNLRAGFGIEVISKEVVKMSCKRLVIKMKLFLKFIA